MWTAKNRGRYDRSKLRYPSDLTDDEWAHIGPVIPPAKRGGNKRHGEGKRACANGSRTAPLLDSTDQGQEAPYSRRYAGFAAPRDRSSR